MKSKFRSYELAHELFLKCEKIRCPKYIRDQMLRAALSIVLNLAEGSQRSSVKDRRRFFNIALGSLRELQAILRILDQKVCSQTAFELGGLVYRLVYPA